MEHVFYVYIDGPKKGQRTKLQGGGPVHVRGREILMEKPDIPKCEGAFQHVGLGGVGDVAATYRREGQTVKIYHSYYPASRPSKTTALSEEATTRLRDTERQLAEARSHIADLNRKLERSKLQIAQLQSNLSGSHALVERYQDMADRARLAESRLEDAHREHVLSEQTIAQLEANLRECVRLLRVAHTCYGNIIPSGEYRLRQCEIRELLAALGVWDV